MGNVLTDFKYLKLSVLVSKLLYEATQVTVVFWHTVCMLVNMIEYVRSTKDFQKRYFSTNEWNEVVSQK